MTEKLNILLVDDKKENLFALETLLEGLNVNILQTTSGFEALKIALDHDIATVLLDIQMPEIDGYEVAKLLKKNSKTSRIPIIFVTAINQEQEHVLQGYETGGVDYLFKPLNPAITIAKVRSFTKLYQQQMELEQKNAELENLNLLIKNAVDLMCVLKNDFSITNPNPAWVKTLGYTTNQLEGSSFLNYITGDDQEFRMVLNKTPKDKHLLNFEQQMIASNGKKFWFSWCFV
jgi:PAS domain S-box-containing protein